MIIDTKFNVNNVVYYIAKLPNDTLTVSQATIASIRIPVLTSKKYEIHYRLQFIRDEFLEADLFACETEAIRKLEFINEMIAYASTHKQFFKQ